MGLERYTVVRKIGEGTYGAAYLVHLRDDPGHALVMYAPRPAPRPRGRLSNTNSLARLRRLLSQGGGVDHVRVVETGQQLHLLHCLPSWMFLLAEGGHLLGSSPCQVVCPP